MVKSDFSRDEIAEKRRALFGLLSGKQKRAVNFPLFLRGAGFYSEMNNLAMLLLYCLHHGIQFRLDSSYMISRLGVKEWTTLFHPFCEERKMRSGGLMRRFSFYKPHLLRALGIAPATSWHSLFQEFRSAPRIMRYDIPELGIKGDMFHALRVMSAILFDLNEEAESRIRTTLGTAYSQAYDLAVHIRKGDKNTEYMTHYSAQDYVNASRSALGIRERGIGVKIFVATDDHRAFEEYQSLYPEARVTSSCRPEHRGYYQNPGALKISRLASSARKPRENTPVFDLLSVEEKNRATYQLLADTHIMTHAKACLGSFFTNVYRAVCVFRGGENCRFINKNVPDYRSPGFHSPGLLKKTAYFAPDRQKQKMPDRKSKRK